MCSLDPHFNMTSKLAPQRIRELLPDLHLGRFTRAASNTLTDIPGVLVSTHQINKSLQHPQKVVNTGVTVIVPRKDWYHNRCYAGFFAFNGVGELSASHWLSETGLLDSPIVMSNSVAVGAAYEGIWQHTMREYGEGEERECDVYPVVAETWDGHLNDLSAFAVKPIDVDTAILTATSSPVREGNSGGGTGMICHCFKAGTGSASRVVPVMDRADGYTIGCISQCNYGLMRDFHVGGKPIGRWMLEKKEKQMSSSSTDAKAGPKRDGSIIVVLATNAPLHPLQLQRLAGRATVGIARVGGYGMHGSGDIFLAFSTAASIPRYDENTSETSLRPSVAFLHDESQTMNGLFEAVADVVEESIYNAICMARTMTRPKGRVVEAIDLNVLREMWTERAE